MTYDPKIYSFESYLRRIILKQSSNPTDTSYYEQIYKRISIPSQDKLEDFCLVGIPSNIEEIDFIRGMRDFFHPQGYLIQEIPQGNEKLWSFRSIENIKQVIAVNLDYIRAMHACMVTVLDRS